MEFNKTRPVIIGIVGHIPPNYLDDFENYLRNYPDFRIVKITTSDKRLWITEQDNGRF